MKLLYFQNYLGRHLITYLFCSFFKGSLAVTWSKFSLKYHFQLWHLKQSTVSSLALTDHSALFSTGRYHSLSSAPILLNLCESAVVGPRLAKVTQLQWLPAACLALHLLPSCGGPGAWSPGPATVTQLHTSLPAQASKGCLEGPTIKHTTILPHVFSWHYDCLTCQTNIHIYCSKTWSGPCLTLGQSSIL